MNSTGTLRQATIVLEFLPPKELSPNYQPHSRVAHIIRTRRVKQMRDSGMAHGLTDLGTWRMVPHVRLTYEFHHYRKIDLDAHDTMMKNWADGLLVDTQVVKDDDPTHVSYGSPGWVKAKKGESRTVITVEEIA